MSDTKPGGDSGADVTQSLGDTLYVVGTDANKFPSTLTDKSRISYDSLEVSATEGVSRTGSSLPAFQQADNAGDHHGGTYSLIALNKIDFTSAAGGINLSTSGNINLMAGGGLVSIMPTMCFTALSKSVHIAGIDAVLIKGNKLVIDSEETTFTKNAKFAKNILVNGSMFVNGELYVNHLTAPQKVMDTNDSPILPVYFNSPTILSGMFIQTCLNPILGFVPAVSMNQVTFILDPMTTTLSQMKVLPHKHSYTSISCDFKESNTEVWAEAVALNNNEAGVTKKDEPYGQKESELLNNIKNKIMSRIGDYLGTLI